ncbi:hypothetical protein BHE74_00012896 [Ensete ventricosum]|nr:hypothetical protein GW17_00026608 [Ensete ventricosum]RWW78852.1 hypothetical protein BHE74_00012896 [Ensete ventricosum]
MGHPPLSPLAGNGPHLRLPSAVEDLIEWICREKSLLPPDPVARKALAGLGEAAAVDVLRKVASCRIKNLSALIMYMASRPDAAQASTHASACFTHSSSAGGKLRFLALEKAFHGYTATPNDFSFSGLQNMDWDSGKAHVYHCHIDLERNITFKVYF